MAQTKTSPAKLPPYKQVPITKLVPYARNARMHSKDQIAQIVASIEEFGFTNPVLIDGNKGIIAGHGRVLAAEKLGYERIPCIEISWLSQAQKRAYIIADNKLAENAGWDRALLRAELGSLAEAGFDLGITGFSDGEIDSLFDQDSALTIHEIHTSEVTDRFWISVRGPLGQQAYALKRLQELMSELDGVEVELGTISLDL